jgi:hypothetical protein
LSNVLIGIIGVILFIGLALAGALILGDDFRTANADSKAAAIQQQLKQVSDAVSMARLKTGAPVLVGPVNASSPLIPRFLKGAPVNPIGSAIGGNGFVLISAIGEQSGSAEAATAIAYMNTDAVSRAACETIDRISGRTTDTQAFDASVRSFRSVDIVGQTGCMFNGAAFIAFHRL